MMLDDFIRRMIRSAIELFPIDAAKKADMRQKIVGEKKTKKENK